MQEYIQLSKEGKREIFADIRKKSDRAIDFYLLFEFFFGLFIAFFYDTWLVALTVAPISISLYYAAKKLFPQSNLYQYILSAISAVFAAQFIYQMHGLFEMHFWVFISATVLIVYQNWRLQLPLIILVVVHHASFAYLQYIGYQNIYFTQLAYMDLTAFLLHGFLAAVVSGISGWWGHLLKKRTIKEAINMRKLEQQRAEIEEAHIRNLEYSEELLQNAEELKANNDELEKTNRLITDRNRDIKSSLQYAQRIQEAMLPSDEKISSAFADSFIFYRPRDIVSGDFYWIDEVNDKQIFVVGDCTGHGVPGAFMSLIGINFLGEIIKANQVTSPAVILELLHAKVHKALKQNQTGNRDGMDIGIAVIDRSRRTLTFAGAKGNMFLWDGQEMHHLKGDSLPIGGYLRTDKSFTEVVTDIPARAVLYGFTDGYRDQIGGPHRRTLTTSGFKAWLTEIAKKPLNLQAAFLGAKIDAWIFEGNEKQLDDMLVVGVKLS